MPPNIKEKDTVTVPALIEEELDIPVPKKEILYDGYFYDVTSFIDRHPGGYVIEYYTNKGEDATLPILEFHNRSRDRVEKIMKTLPRRPAQEHESKYIFLKSKLIFS
jgi:hypothetical protein